MRYAGIGSRRAPEWALNLAFELGRRLARKGYVLYSGAAEGMDAYFERGALWEEGDVRIFLPWNGFNGRPHDGERYFALENLDNRFEAEDLARRVHPTFDRLKQGGKKLQARNSYQALDLCLTRPVDFCLCYTPDGCEDGRETTKRTGGTGQALRLLTMNGVRIYNMGNSATREKIERSLV